MTKLPEKLKRLKPYIKGYPPGLLKTNKALLLYCYSASGDGKLGMNYIYLLKASLFG